MTLEELIGDSGLIREGFLIMMLEELIGANGLMKLDSPYGNWVRCGRATGRYYYNSITGIKEPRFLMIEVRNRFFPFIKSWVPIGNLRAIETMECKKYD